MYSLLSKSGAHQNQEGTKLRRICRSGVKGRSTGAVQVHRCGLGPPVRWSERQVLGSTQQAKQATELGSLGTHQVSTRPKGS